MTVPITSENITRLRPVQLLTDNKPLKKMTISKLGEKITAIVKDEKEWACGVVVWGRNGNVIAETRTRLWWIEEFILAFWTQENYLLLGGVNDEAQDFNEHLKLWEIGTDRFTFLLDPELNRVWSAVLSPDGRYLAFNSHNKFYIIQTPNISLDDARHLAITNQLIGVGAATWIKHFLVPKDKLNIVYETPAVVGGGNIVFSPNGRFVAHNQTLGDPKFGVFIVDTNNWKRYNISHIDARCFCFPQDSKQALVSNILSRRFTLWDVINAQPIMEQYGEMEIKSAAYTPNNQVLVTGHENGWLYYWDAHTLEKLGQYQGHKETIHTITFSYLGNEMFTADNLNILIWQVQ